MFEQATIPVQNEKTFAEVQGALDEAFAPARVVKFLSRIAGAKLRVRQFEEVLQRGYLGEKTRVAYAALGPSDQGQIREQYLRRVEQVSPDARQRFYRIYASY